MHVAEERDPICSVKASKLRGRGPLRPNRGIIVGRMQYGKNGFDFSWLRRRHSSLMTT